MQIQFRVVIAAIFILMTSITATMGTLGWLAELFGHGHGTNDYGSSYGYGANGGYGYGQGHNRPRPPESSWTSKFPWLGNKGGFGDGWNWKGNRWAGGSGSIGNGHGGGWKSGSNIYNREATSPWAGISGGYLGQSSWTPLANRWQYQNNGGSRFI